MRVGCTSQICRHPLNPPPPTPDTPHMPRRAPIAELASSACLALTGVGALFAMMLQFVYPNESWPAWTAGAFAVAGVGGVMLFAQVSARAARRDSDTEPLATIGPEQPAETRRAA